MFGFLGGSVDDIILSQNQLIRDWHAAVANIVSGKVVNTKEFKLRVNSISKDIISSLKTLDPKEVRRVISRQNQIKNLIAGRPVGVSRDFHGQHRNRGISGFSGIEETKTYEMFHRKFLGTLASRDFQLEEQAFARMSVSEQAAYGDSIAYSRQLAAKSSGALEARAAGQELLAAAKVNARPVDPSAAFWGSLKKDASGLTGGAGKFFSDMFVSGKTVAGIAALAIGAYVLNSISRARGK